MVNPFNGEGIAYAMESGRIAAETILESRQERTDRAKESRLEQYPVRLRSEWGSYYTLGRAFVKLIGHDQVMKIATKKALPHPTLMRFTIKLLANLTDAHGGDVMDRVINALIRLTPTT